MKKLLKILAVLFVLLLVLVTGAVAYIVNFRPAIPAHKDLKVAITPERVARGEYLAHHVAACMDCHSTRDWSLFTGPLKDGTLGVGGERFDQSMNFPGAFIAPNITPHGLKDWSDGEVYRAITSGVSKDGRPLFPIMPYPAYSRMDTEDIHSIIAYIRSLPAIASSPAKSQADVPMNVIMHLIPQPAKPATMPAKTDIVAYGGYLTNAAACTECHTKMEKGKPVGEPFAGGFEFAMPSGTLRSANITPHPTTGIGAWTKEVFIARFKAYAKGTFQAPAVAEGQMQTAMPWTMYAGMNEEDLSAIFAYLQTLKPVENTMEKWSPRKKAQG